MAKKKVLFVATVISHINCFHLPYLKLFHDNGYEVHVATNEKSNIEYCDKSIEIPITRSPYKISNLKAIKRLKSIIAKENYDIIHCHTPMGSVVARLAAKQARKKNTRVIYTAHGFHFHQGAPIINWLLYYPIEKWLSKYTDTLITINKEDFNLAKRKFNRRCNEILYVPGVGVDPQKFLKKINQNEKKQLRESLGLKKDDFILIFPARLDKNKNQIFLINAMEKLVNKHSNIHLLLPGADELNGYYQEITKTKKLDNNIHFLGHRNDIPQLLQICDLAVSSSLREGLGLNLVEAIYCNTPVIAYNNRGHKEIINNDNGFLYQNENEFIDAINKYYSIEKKHNISSSVEKFMLNNCLNEMKKIYFQDNKLLFIHTSEKIKEDTKGNYYTDGCYNDAVWERYLKILPKVQAIFRKENEIYPQKDILNKFHKLNENVEAITIENRNESIKNYLSLKVYLNNRKIIKNAVRNASMVIIRVPCEESYQAIKYAKKYNKKCLVEIVGCPLDTLWNYSLKGKILSIPSYFKMKKTVKLSDYAIYVTNMFLQKRYPTKGIQIGCSDVSLTEFDTSVLTKRIKKIENKKDSKKIILCTVGTVGVMYKGQQDVIKAIANLKSAKYNIEYWIIGAGDNTYLKELTKKYNLDNIKFLGFLNHKEIFEKLDKIDVYIQPSYTEGLCRALIEALSRACPSIASDAGGNIELVDKEFIYKKGDIDELTNKITKIIETKVMKQQATNNFELAKNYKMETLDKKRDEFYKQFKEEKRK